MLLESMKTLWPKDQQKSFVFISPLIKNTKFDIYVPKNPQLWTMTGLFQKTFIKQKQRQAQDHLLTRNNNQFWKSKSWIFTKNFNASDYFLCTLVKIFVKIWIHSFGIGCWIQWARIIQKKRKNLADFSEV